MHITEALVRRDQNEIVNSFENLNQGDRYKNILQELTLSSAENKRRLRSIESNPPDYHDGATKNDRKPFNKDLDGIALTHDVSNGT